jgi:hypothetical protein
MTFCNTTLNKGHSLSTFFSMSNRQPSQAFRAGTQTRTKTYHSSGTLPPWEFQMSSSRNPQSGTEQLQLEAADQG